MRVRSAAPEDFQPVCELLEELGRAAVTAETREACGRLWAYELVDPRVDHLVAESPAGAVVAFCSLHYRSRLNYPTPDAWIPDLIVTFPERGKGAARALLGEAERRARERGCWALTLESGYQRKEAHALYLSLGLEDKGLYFGKPLE